MSNSPNEAKTIIRENLQLYLILSDPVARRAGLRVAAKIDSINLTGGGWRCRFTGIPGEEWYPSPGDASGIIIPSPKGKKIRFRKITIESSFSGILYPPATIRKFSGYWTPVEAQKKI